MQFSTTKKEPLLQNYENRKSPLVLDRDLDEMSIELQIKYMHLHGLICFHLLISSAWQSARLGWLFPPPQMAIQTYGCYMLGGTSLPTCGCVYGSGSVFL